MSGAGQVLTAVLGVSGIGNVNLAGAPGVQLYPRVQIPLAHSADLGENRVCLLLERRCFNVPEGSESG